MTKLLIFFGIWMVMSILGRLAGGPAEPEPRASEEFEPFSPEWWVMQEAQQQRKDDRGLQQPSGRGEAAVVPARPDTTRPLEERAHLHAGGQQRLGGAGMRGAQISASRGESASAGLPSHRIGSESLAARGVPGALRSRRGASLGDARYARSRPDYGDAYGVRARRRAVDLMKIGGDRLTGAQRAFVLAELLNGSPPALRRPGDRSSRRDRG